jgi:hypothetical protein
VLRFSRPAVRCPSQRLVAWKRLGLGLAVCLCLSPPAIASAAPAAGKARQTTSKPSPDGQTTASGASRGKTGPGGKKVISLDDEFLVEGQLEKPSAFYVLRRSSTDYDWARLDATMTPLVLESVWDPLF